LFEGACDLKKEAEIASTFVHLIFRPSPDRSRGQALPDFQTQNSASFIKAIDFQILNFTSPEGGIRVSRTLSTSSRIPTDNAVKFNI